MVEMDRLGAFDDQTLVDDVDEAIVDDELDGLPPMLAQILH